MSERIVVGFHKEGKEYILEVEEIPPKWSEVRGGLAIAKLVMDSRLYRWVRYGSPWRGWVRYIAWPSEYTILSTADYLLMTSCFCALTPGVSIVEDGTMHSHRFAVATVRSCVTALLNAARRDGYELVIKG